MEGTTRKGRKEIRRLHQDADRVVIRPMKPVVVPRVSKNDLTFSDVFVNILLLLFVLIVTITYFLGVHVYEDIEKEEPSEEEKTQLNKPNDSFVPNEIIINVE